MTPTATESDVQVRKGWRTPAVLYRLISHPVLRFVLGWDLPSRDVGKWVQRKPGGTTVEIGSGGGFFTTALREHLGADNRLIGLDPAAGAQKKLADKHAGAPGADLVLVAGDGCKLPFADNSVDTIFFTYSLEEVPDPLAAVREAVRVLRPGGQFVAFVWRPVILHKRRKPVQILIDTLLTRENASKGPQNLRLSYRKAAA
ncbi:class I SAM-dependent methyltransferase [Crossiella cryophila]|uniref:Ubiquinone/menaquinone biosynthesis C-methylase UbiE n=1 Tax=Crossiella cryophila TaxID=43355 RepID=A0A7W7CDH0_9PSEU|nr:class I SAM-dependent methyltransferase [Crossiella cryophila]MBB4677838.1 ubiquinone/menaquinone biosynthesis C-methylase UbiE [Crossiella cryophila]